MQVILAVIAAGAGILGMVYAALPRGGQDWRTRAAALQDLRPVVLLAGALLLVLFLLTLPAAPPFSPGLQLGWGLLIGGAFALYALLETTGRSEEGAWVYRAVGLLSASVVGPSAILVLFRGDPRYALTGCALGAVALAALSAGVLRPIFVTSPTPGTGWRAFRGVEVFALATTIVVAGALLGIDHFPRAATHTLPGGYWALPGLLLAAGALALAASAGGWVLRAARWQALLLGIIGAAALTLTTAILGSKLLPAVSWLLPLYGLLAFAVLLMAFQRDEALGDGEGRPVTLAFGAVFVMLALVAVTFRTMQGYGEALAALPAILIVGAVTLGRQSERAPLAPALGTGAVVLLLLLTLFRAFIEHAGPGWRLDFQQQYDIFAVLIGVAVCFGLLAFAMRNVALVQAARAGGRLAFLPLALRTTLAGALVAALPIVLAAVWGSKSIGAFVIGLVVAEAVWMLLAAWTVGEERTRVLTAAPHLFLVGAALVAVQMTPVMAAMNLTITAKMWIVGAATVLTLAWVVMDGLRTQRAPAPAPGGQV